MKKRQQKQWRSPVRRPVREINKIIGVVWSVPSYAAARDAILEIKRIQHELRLGPFVTDATLFSSSDNDGYCVVLVGIGEMFSAPFLARCGACVYDKNGSILPESQRKKDLIKWAHTEWIKVRKQEHRKSRAFLNSMRKNSI